MSVNSKTLRDRAATQLRAGRKVKNRIQKGIHNDRAAAFKALAAGPAPVLTKPQLAATAEEVRCLADKEVGGMRLMMARADRDKPAIT